MNEKDIIRAIMTDRGVSQTLLAQKLGYKFQSGVGSRLNGKNTMTLENFVAFLEAMDYEVIVKSKTKTGDTYKVVLTEETK